MQAVLDRPAVPDGLQELLGGHLPAHEAGAGLGARPAFDLADRLDLADGREARPSAVGRRRSLRKSCSRPMPQETVAARVPMRPRPQPSS